MYNINYYLKAMEKKTILKGLVKVVQNDKTLNSDVLILDLEGVKGVIIRDEVDGDVNWKSLVGFVGRSINFIVKSVDKETGVISCSRKDAQAIQKEAVTKCLQEGEVRSAQIVNIVNFGAYVEIEGVSGLLKNVDFAEDFTTIGEVHKLNDSINVRLKKISEHNKLIFEAVEKYKNPTIMSFETFEKDQVVLGVIRGVKPWGAYVCIAPGLDALCPIPATDEIEEGMKVSFRITQVNAEEKRVRGKIIRVI